MVIVLFGGGWGRMYDPAFLVKLVGQGRLVLAGHWWGYDTYRWEDD